ncbi:MAG TPA: asparagine synthase (glutamine-hydrolyzing) [Dehalococcoidia bacterium]|nr:asparagine synthase (glutamine-hydrolyzing) [Dehalococcoidia bacterium]
MCGISALFSPDRRVVASDIDAMTRVVRHRGPDGEGYVAFEGPDLQPACLAGTDTPGHIATAGLPYSPAGSIGEAGARGAVAALGHRRLSIIDLSAAGHQPMCTADRRYWIVFNGEIYNYRELRAELERAGAAFSSQTDTEVLLAAYREWGEDCLARLNGMFAFVIVDRVRRAAFAARDRFGVKPLYYWISPEGLLAFASEIKQFGALPGWDARLNGQRAYDFLNWGLFDHTSETLFAGVRQLRGGECAMLPLDAPRELRIRRWYELVPARAVADSREAAGKFRALLEDSVRLRLRADVPVGSCLSGGLDSSSIVCLVSRLLHDAGAHDKQKTFSARSSDPRYDEGRFIDEVIRATGVVNHQVDPSPGRLFELLPEITWHQDEPFGSTSIYAQWHVFALAAEHGVKVMLDGQGADEQLAGYHSFFTARLAGLAGRLRLIELARETVALQRLHGLGTQRIAAHIAGPLLPESVRQPLRRLLGRPAIGPGSWLDLDRLGARTSDPFLAYGAGATTVRAMSQSQLLHTSLPMLLHWEDRDSMAHSVEARVPFLDYRLVEFVLGLPDELKLSRGVTKRVLRDATVGILPEPVRERMDKIGFATAEEDWLRREQPDDFRRAVDAAVRASDGVLRPEARAVLEEVIQGCRPFSFLPWRMISFGAWLERFGVSVSP